MVGIVAAGLGAGTVIAMLAFAAEHSPIDAGGPLSGTGAILVPALLAPWAVYWGWTAILARRGRALELALFVTGLDLGVGVWIVLDGTFSPQPDGVTFADALPGLVLSGSTLVLPAALLAGAAYGLFTTRLPLNSFTLFAAAFAAAVLVVANWAGLGVLAGTCVAAAARDPARRLPIGVALLVLLVVVAFLPFYPGLIGAQDG